MESVGGQHAPGTEVAESLASAVDGPLRVERQLDADDLVIVEEHEPRVRALDGPRYVDRVLPLVGRYALVQVDL